MHISLICYFMRTMRRLMSKCKNKLIKFLHVTRRKIEYNFRIIFKIYNCISYRMLFIHIHLTFQLLAIIIHQKPFYDSNKGFLSSPRLSNELCCVMMYHTNQPFLHSVLCSLLSLRDPLSHALKWGPGLNLFTLKIHSQDSVGIKSNNIKDM